MWVETAFSDHKAHVVDVAQVSGIALDANIKYAHRNVIFTSEGVLAYHYPSAINPLAGRSLKHSAWLPLIEQGMLQGKDRWNSSQQLPPTVFDEEFYRGYMVDFFSDGLAVVAVKSVGVGKNKRDLQQPFYVLVRDEHLGHTSGNTEMGGSYDEHGKNLNIGDITWHSHEAAIYLNNYGKQRFFGIKGDDTEAYHYYGNALGTVDYDGVFVLYEKNDIQQVGLASLVKPELLRVQHIDGTSETIRASAIKDVLVVHHPDYAGDGRQVSLTPADFRPLSAEHDDVFGDEVYEDDRLLARVVLVLTGGWRVVEVSKAQEGDGEVFQLDTPVLGLVQEGRLTDN